MIDHQELNERVLETLEDDFRKAKFLIDAALTELEQIETRNNALFNEIDAQYLSGELDEIQVAANAVHQTSMYYREVLKKLMKADPSFAEQALDRLRLEI